jgi:hypothetical protein
METDRLYHCLIHNGGAKQTGRGESSITLACGDLVRFERPPPIDDQTASLPLASARAAVAQLRHSTRLSKHSTRGSAQSPPRPTPSSCSTPLTKAE